MSSLCVNERYLSDSLSESIVCVCVQIANTNPLVSDRQELTVLQKEYAEDDTVYQLKIKVSLQLHSHLDSPPQLSSITWISTCS